MKSTTTLVARQYRLCEWAEQIHECNNHPSNLTVKKWCNQHQTTVANYYYRLRQVRAACLENIPVEPEPQSIVPVPTRLMTTISSAPSCLEITTNRVCIRVTEHTSSELLKMVLRVVSDAQ